MSIPSSTVYILYVDDPSVPVPKSIDITSKSTVSNFTTKRFPMMWFGSTEVLKLDNIIYDKKSSYLKFKNQKRYYRSFMDLFKYVEQQHESNPNLVIKLHTLETGVTDVDSVIKKYLLIYRLRYGTNVILSDPKHKLMVEEYVGKISTLSFSRIVYDPSVPADERKKLSNQKYIDTHRERLNAKSKRYYERNKEKLKEKRDAKKASVIEAVAQVAVIENTAQV
jgi:hypothetical protein